MQTKKIDNNTFFAPVSEFLKEGKDVRIRVRGRSMLPFLNQDKDEVMLRKISTQIIEKGTIVLAHIDGRQYILHRVLRRDGDTLILRGDGNIGTTEECGVEDVMAVVQKKIRAGKETDLSSPLWSFYASVWNNLHFGRRILLFIYNVETEEKYLLKKLNFKQQKL